MLLEGDGWRTKEARSLTAEAKCLYLWLLTGPHPDSSGLVLASTEAICEETGMLPVNLIAARSQLRNIGLVVEDGEWILALENITHGSSAARARAARAALRRLPADSPLRTVVTKHVPEPGRERGQRRLKADRRGPGQQSLSVDRPAANVVPIRQRKTGGSSDNPFGLRGGDS